MSTVLIQLINEVSIQRTFEELGIYRQFNKGIDKMEEKKTLTFLYSQADTTHCIHALKINNNESQVRGLDSTMCHS